MTEEAVISAATVKAYLGASPREEEPGMLDAYGGMTLADARDSFERDLIAAQSSEMAARVAYIMARLALEQTTGEILAANHVSLAEARQGKVERQSVIGEPASAK